MGWSFCRFLRLPCSRPLSQWRSRGPQLRWTSMSSMSRAATPRCSFRLPVSRCSSIPAMPAPRPPRDAGRIMEAIKDAGLQQIDHLITTHWHGDHFGGMAELASRVPIREFIDHGPNVQPGEAADTFLQNTYPQLYAKAKHTVVKAG